MKYCIAILLLAILAVVMAEKVSQSEKIDAKEADPRSKRGLAYSGYDTSLAYPYVSPYIGHGYGYGYPYGYPYGYSSYYPTYRYRPYHYYDSYPYTY